MSRVPLSQRLLLLLLAAMLPLVGVLFYNLYVLHQEREEEVRTEVFQTGQLIALEIQRIVAGMENVLTTISLSPAVTGLDEKQCGEFLSATTRALDGVLGISVIDLQGIIRCRSDSRGLGVSVADRSYFKEALKSGGFVIGEYTEGHVTKEKFLPLAVPMKDKAGSVIGVIAMSVDLEWLQKLLVQRNFDEGAALAIADKKGVILARFPQPERFVGTLIPEQYRYLVTAETPGTIDLTSQDGTGRILAYFPEKAPPRGLYISKGLSVEHSFASIRKATLLSIIATIVALAISLGLVWQTNRFAIQKRVGRILTAVARWRRGDNAARTGMVPGDGELGAIGSAIDDFMDELVQARRQEALLQGEMSHRIKNLLAMVQSVASQSFRGKVPSETLAPFGQRLRAIGDAFEVLRNGGERSASFAELVKASVAPFHDAEHPQFLLEGEDFEVGAPAALAIVMALHELATNAAKYGALSVPGGTVRIKWETKHQDEPQVVFVWEEHDGPPVVPPSNSGFGSMMVERVLSGQIGGSVTLDYRESGLVCTFTAPLEGMKASYPGEKTPVANEG